MIKEEIRSALFKEIHKAIDKSAEAVSQLQTTDLSYPPGVELTRDEVAALSSLNLSGPAKSGLRKLVADASAFPLFHLFSLLDAVADPETELDDVWLGATIESKSDDRDEPMLHDELYESYWLYKEEKSGSRLTAAFSGWVEALAPVPNDVGDCSNYYGPPLTPSVINVE